MKRNGISLMEVLASTFVIGVGLLGVLAVIPFGAYQVSKARDAEHCANMLDAASKDLRVFGIAKPETWNPNNSVSLNSSGGTLVYEKNGSVHRLNCSRIFMVDPFDDPATADRSHIFRVGTNFQNPGAGIWRERMRGQDDLEFTTHSSKRTDFSSTGGRIISSGKYTWFFTFQPKDFDATDNSNKAQIPIANIGNTRSTVNNLVDVDILGCYNRIAGEERSVEVTAIDRYQKAANLTIRAANSSDLDISKIKYVFVTWVKGDYSDFYDGAWCKILNASDITTSGGNYERNIILFDPNQLLSSVNLSNARALLVDGVLYHKRVENVPLNAN